MKVVHICTYLGVGGAAVATKNLHLGLRQLGVESFVLSCVGANAIPHTEEYFDLQQQKLIQCAKMLLVDDKRNTKSNSMFSLDLLGGDLSGHPLIRKADILHLHWISQFLSSASIAKLATLNKPIIWTVHDMRPVTGGCHDSAGCMRFREACGNCPQLNTELLNFTANNLKTMVSTVAAAKPIFVTPSKWMLGQVRKSQVGRNAVSYCIPNGCDFTIFKPLEKNLCRTKLNLRQDVWYILVTAHDILEIRKGATHALAILEAIRQYPPTSELVATGKMRVLCCSKNANQFCPEGWQMDRFGNVTSDEMSLFYNSANMFLFTSLEDNFPNVILEAMACGTPVVAHRVGGAVDMLNSGPLSDCLFDVSNIAEAVSIVFRLRNPDFYKEVSLQSIKKVTENYSLEKQAFAYQQLYKERLTRVWSSANQTTSLSSEIPTQEGSAEALLFCLERAAAQLLENRMRIKNLRSLIRKMG